MAGFKVEETEYFNILKPYNANDRLLSYTQTFSKSLVDHPKDYKLCLDKFDIPTTSIPIFIFNTEMNYYTVELCWGNYTNSKLVTVGNIDFIRTEGALNITYSSGEVGIEELGTPFNINSGSVGASSGGTRAPYFNYIYSYNDFIRMINKALQTAMQLLSVAGAPIATAQLPYFELDSTTNTFSLVVDNAFFNQTSANYIMLFMNRNMNRFFTGFPSFLQTTQSGAKSRLFEVYPMNNNSFTSGSYTFLRMKSEYGAQTLIGWNDAKGLVFTSDLVPIKTEQLPTTQGDITTYNAPVRGILASYDFVYTESEITPLKAQYLLTSPYKVIDMKTDFPLNKFDIHIYWVDNKNNLYDMFLFSGEAWSVRFCFIKTD